MTTIAESADRRTLFAICLRITGHTQESFASLLGISQAYLSLVLSGARTSDRVWCEVEGFIRQTLPHLRKLTDEAEVLIEAA